MKLPSYFFIVIVLAISASSCKKKVCKDCWAIPPSSNILFKITKNNVSLDDSAISKTTMYYIDKNGQMVTDPDHTEISTPGQDVDDSLFMYLAYNYYSDHPEEFKNSHIALFGFPVLLSAQAGIQNFYFKYPDGDIDTLFLRAEEVSQEQGKKEDCYCTTPVRELKFNGKDVNDDSITLATGEKVYLFEK